MQFVDYYLIIPTCNASRVSKLTDFNNWTSTKAFSPQIVNRYLLNDYDESGIF